VAGARKTWHVHACRACGIRYVDGCDQINEDDRCTGCRGGRPWQLLIDNAAPRECCLRSRLATKDERKTYRLAGRSNWHICPVCKRTQGHKPREEEVFRA
jgi:hypothetical protein